jgi:ATP-dependent 26S proteasome regulatory subunit
MKLDGLKLLIAAGNPIISITSPDEPRAARAVMEVAQAIGLPVAFWSLTEGLQACGVEKVLVEAGKVAAALKYVKDSAYPGLYVFRDLGQHAKDPQVLRYLRDLYFSPVSRPWTVLLLDSSPPPMEMRRLSLPFEIGWPDEEEILALVRKTYQDAQQRSLQKVESRLSKKEMELVVQTLRGLTSEEIVRVVSEVLYEDYVLDRTDLPRLVEAKRIRLAATGCLESIVADVSPDEIGGLRNLKRWLNQRLSGFSARGREFGLEPPRGILLLGVQGCGKSLCAKVIATAWRMPLVRMDPGVLYQKFVGETEARLRDALQQAEAMAPVVFWIDEIEKAFASASSDSADGGLSQRMFGTLLTWMQDHRQPIFIVATANDIERLPPELMRKGRFDEIFFVDLPGAEEREAIFAIHLRKRGREKANFDLARLTEASAKFTGAEIEQAVISAMYSAYAEEGEFTTEHILQAIRATRPLSVVMHERVEQLQNWAKGRCVMAD